MKINYLFPHNYKLIGWLILIPSIILGLVTFDNQPDFFDFKVPAIYIEKVNLSDNDYKQLFLIIKNNVLNEIFGIAIIISSLLIAFSKEKTEDEYISKIRLESLVWAVYVNYGILILSFLFIYELAFLWVLLFNIFTVLWFFIIKFNWQISNFKKSARHEE